MMMNAVPDEMHMRVVMLGRAIGLDPLVLDDDGQLAFDVGNGLTLHLVAEPEQMAFLLFGVAGTLPEPAPVELLTRLLQANFVCGNAQGVTLSLDGHSPANVVLARRLAWESLTDGLFLSAFNATAGALQASQGWLLEQFSAVTAPTRW